jgi:phosphatidylglycerol---prolipoprotein diacylglyceryl transferase
MLADATSAIRFEDLGLKPILFEYGWFKLRWYSLAYIFGIIFGWWYLLKMIAQPGAPLARRHVDDFVFYATLGIILGGRIGYVLFYRPEMLLTPTEVFKLWDGGMSFHGGVIGVTFAILWFCRQNGLKWLRVHDYVAVVYPVGHLFGRLANFVNGELWGRETDVSWGMIFPDDPLGLVRHPSQLYQAGSEGILLGLILWFLFWKTDARYEPGKLVGAFIGGMGLFRFIGEFFREPDNGVGIILGMSRGQLLCVPMIIGGAYLLATAKGRRKRVESIAGTSSVA